MAFALCAREGFDRLQCSLRPDSAAASCGVGPSQLHKRGHSVLPCTPSVGSAEPFLRSQEGSGKGGLSRFARGMGLIAFNARSGTIPLRCGFEWAPRRSAAGWGGSAEPFLRSQEGLGKEELSRFARGMGLIAFNARSGTIPLRCGFEWAPRRSAAVCGGSAEPFLRSQEGSGKGGLSRFARGVGLIAFNARSGPVPLPLRAGLLNRGRWFWGRLWKVGWIVDVRYGMKRTPNTGVVVASHELGSESRNPTLRSAAFGSSPP